MTEKLLSALIGGLVGVVVGPLASWLLEILNRRRSRFEVAAALRFEIASNVLWLDSILTSRNFLRTEAWTTMKNNGYISYLKAPLPMMIARTYERMHSLNGLIERMRPSEVVSEESMNEIVERIRGLRLMSKDLSDLLDLTYPKLGRNFSE